MVRSHSVGLLLAGLFFLVNKPIVSQAHIGIVLDMVVVFDIQASRDAETTAALQHFVYYLGDLIGVSEDGSQMTVVSVVDSTNTLPSLSDGINIDAVADAFAYVQNGGGSVEDLTLNLSSAIQKAEDILSQPDNRPEVPDIVIVVTDGQGGGISKGTYALSPIVVTVGNNTASTVDVNSTIHVQNVQELTDEEKQVLILEALIDFLIEIVGDRVFRSLCEQQITLFFAEIEDDADGKRKCFRFWVRQCYCLVVDNNVFQYKFLNEECTCTKEKCDEGRFQATGRTVVPKAECDKFREEEERRRKEEEEKEG